jgi:DNA repair protein RadC
MRLGRFLHARAHDFRGFTVTQERKDKLTSVVYAMRELGEFSFEGAKLRCKDTHPAYITRVIKQMNKDGLLDRLQKENREVYRWSQSSAVDPEFWIDRQVYGEQVKQTPEEDRPREVLLRDGASKLTDGQLIAILIRVGVVGESAVQAGRLLSNRFPSDKLAKLQEASLPELRSISKAIRKDSYSQIMAGIELGRRVAKLRDDTSEVRDKIQGSDDAIRYCKRAFARLAADGKQEEFHIVTLDTQYRPIGEHRITVGTLDASLVHPREVFRPAIRDSASAILLVHNHPSGDPTPSREDIAVTDRLSKAGDLLGIRVLDHIVVARTSCRSVLAEI